MKLFLTILVLLFGVNASAESEEYDLDQQYEYCMEVGVIAHGIMTEYLTNGNRDISKLSKKYFESDQARDIVFAAFEYERIAFTPKRTITNFASEQIVNCLQ